MPFAPSLSPAPGALALAAALFAAGAVAAQEAPRPLDPPRGETGRAFEAALAGAGIHSRVDYFDPDGPAPDLTLAAPPEPTRPEAQAEIPDWAVTTVAAITLAFIAWLIWRSGAIGPVSLRAAPERAARPAPRGRAPAPAPIHHDPDLAAIAATADRREALAALARAALSRAATAEGLRLGRSATAREALRRLPRTAAHRAALEALTRAAELAHFGGRDVPEEVFAAHLDAASPLFGKARA